MGGVIPRRETSPIIAVVEGSTLFPEGGNDNLHVHPVEEQEVIHDLVMLYPNCPNPKERYYINKYV